MLIYTLINKYIFEVCMQTEMIMQRDLGGYKIRQNHKTQMFSANDLLLVANEARKAKGLAEKQLINYFSNDAYIELEKELLWEHPPELVRKTVRGHNSGTWVHPIVFIDLAMWLSPEFKVRVLKWVYDGLILARDESGDSFKEMMSVLTRHYASEVEIPITYKRISRVISDACEVYGGPDKWQTATENQLKLRDKIHQNIIFFAGEKPTLQECVTTAIRKTLERNQLN